MNETGVPLTASHRHQVNCDQEAGVRQSGNAYKGSGWRPVRIPLIGHGRVGLHIDEPVNKR